MSSKLKKVIIKNMGNQDTPESRKALAKKEGEKFQAFLTIPSEIKENIHEGFDPLLVSGEVIEAHFVKLINSILDFDDANKSDGQFVDLMKD